MTKKIYRAWDKDSKIMVYSDYRNRREYFCEYWFEENENGVEIYEEVN